MKRLILVRHAEAVGPKSNRSDFERPLTPEGEKQAESMGKKMKKEGVKVDLLISSPADRALETAHIFARRLDYPIQKILLFDAIYKASDGSSLLRLIKDMDDRYGNLLMVGHNPRLSEMAKHLVKDLRHDIPKAGMVRIEFSVSSWKEAGPENAHLRSFDIPGGDVRAKNWQKKIRRELTSRMTRQNMAILESLDKDAAAEVVPILKNSLKKTASSFVKEARNFSLTDVSWLEALEAEPNTKRKRSPSGQRCLEKKSKSRPAGPDQAKTSKQAKPQSPSAPNDSGIESPAPALLAQKEPEVE